MAIDPSQIKNVPQNIFSTPLKKAEDKKPEIKNHDTLKGWFYLGLSLTLLIPYCLLFLYPQTQSFLAFHQDLNALQKEISEADSSLSALKKTEKTHKAAYDKTFEEEQAVLDVVFPETPDKLSVIKLLENFATRLSAAYPPFEFTSISFDEPVQKEGYTLLPFQTTVHSSRKNFERFLALVDLSGNDDPKQPDHIRLMEIANISLRYRGPDGEGQDQGVDFTVELNAYSR